MLINTALLSASASGGGSPTVYTLTLDDLLTRFAEYTGAAASIKFKLTSTNGGGALTHDDFVYLDSSGGTGNATGSLATVGAVAELIAGQLNSLSGYSGVTVNGVATVPGDQWDFTITFPVALGVTDLAFHASSQWYPTIALLETVDSEGVANSPPTSAEVSVNSIDDTTVDTEGNSVTVDGGSIYVSHTAGTGWSAGATGSSMSFFRDSPGVWDSTGYGKSSGSGGASVVSEGTNEGNDGSPEVHTITPQPVNPTGGTWKPGSGGSAVQYDDASPENQAFVAGEWSSVSKVSGTSLSAGALQFTNGPSGDVGDLSPVNVDLTAPEITHSITPA